MATRHWPDMYSSEMFISAYVINITHMLTCCSQGAPSWENLCICLEMIPHLFSVWMNCGPLSGKHLEFERTCDHSELFTLTPTRGQLKVFCHQGRGRDILLWLDKNGSIPFHCSIDRASVQTSISCTIVVIAAPFHKRFPFYKRLIFVVLKDAKLIL